MNPRRLIASSPVPLVLGACVLGTGVVGGVAGCASASRNAAARVDAQPSYAELHFDQSAYHAVFDSARDALLELRFTPDRIDAARGVITTQPKRTVGLATPWDREQSSLGEEARDLFHQHERVCTITFDPPDAPEVVRIEVALLRARRPGWRVETDAIRLSTHAVDPAARRAGDEPEFREPIGSDASLARRIAEDIARRSGIAVYPGEG